MMVVDENRVYTPQETITILKISDSTFRRMVRRGVLQAAKIGGQYRVLGREILSLFNPKVQQKALNAFQKVKVGIKNKLDL